MVELYGEERVCLFASRGEMREEQTQTSKSRRNQRPVLSRLYVMSRDESTECIYVTRGSPWREFAGVNSSTVQYICAS